MPLPLTGDGVGYSCSSLALGLADDETRVCVVTSRSRLSLPSVEVVETLPPWARFAPYRWVKASAERRLEQALLSRMAASAPAPRVAYLWPGASLDTISALKRDGVVVIREQFNCHTGAAKAILDEAYEKLGAAASHKIAGSVIEAERRVLEAVDYVFCPGPNVAKSLTDNGVDPAKLLPASYGWDPARLAAGRRTIPADKGVTFLFVGSLCVRKGVHLLLDYWARSGIKGRLVLVGEMEPVIKERCAALLARDDVLVMDYSRDVGALYRTADAFVFPTLEEGSPLVVYEACGAGLPVLTTYMGAGSVVRPGREGAIVDAYDAQGWIAALRGLAEDRNLRERLSQSASERALEFVWPRVAARRRAQIEACFSERPAARARPPRSEALI
jgi:glycosyltransferase involved in cell wall biosynthesis